MCIKRLEHDHEINMSIEVAQISSRYIPLYIHLEQNMC